MNWIWKPFFQLTIDELYAILQLRERVFVVEQNCIYLDCDGLDSKAWHLAAYEEGTLVAYLRAFPPGIKYPECSIGRVVTAPESRKEGYGKKLIKEALKQMEMTFGPQSIRISAQSYLVKFYSDFGFRTVSEEYLEDGIPHTEMLRAASEI